MKASEFLDQYRKRQKRNKFNASTTNYNGRNYHSKLEASYAMELDWMKKAGMIKDWVPQFKLDLRVNGEHITNYYVDFKVIANDNSIEYHEVKGRETREWINKWRHAKAQFTDNKFILIK